MQRPLHHALGCSRHITVLNRHPDAIPQTRFCWKRQAATYVTQEVHSEHSSAQCTSGITDCGSSYYVSGEDKQLFQMLGFVTLPQVLTEEQMQQEIDPVGSSLPGKLQ